MSPVVVREEPLRQFVQGVCAAMGAPGEVAAEVAAHLVRASLSGHDAQGVARLPEYAAETAAGTLVASAVPRVLRETAVTALFDAGGGFGQYSTAVALAWCVERARTSGLAAAAVRRSSDIGRVGDYGERAAEAGMLAMVTAGAVGPGAGDVMLFGGRDRFLGGNPWCLAAPGRGRSMVVAGATSAVSEADVRLARARGERLPPDCVYDRYGRPSTDPDDLFAGGGLAPLGAAVAGRFGSGLGLASALFGGLAMTGEETEVGDPVGGVFLQVVHPAAFGDLASYRDLVEGALRAAAATRPGAGRGDVLLPGEPERRSRAERRRTGVLLPDATWTDLSGLADQFAVALPPRG
ncbi:MAG TPA: Ldh family oxidoreductase [Terriglobales bacterium]|nr:Ldh family oxidoreductase [Terriglobales bacterium]